MTDAVLEVSKSTSAISVSKFGAIKRISKKQQRQQCRQIRVVHGIEKVPLWDRGEKMVPPEAMGRLGARQSPTLMPSECYHPYHTISSLCTNQLQEENL